MASEPKQASKFPFGLDDDVIRQALEESPDGLLIAEGDGTILFANRALCRMTGYGPAELVGRSVDVLVPPHSQVRHRDLREGYARDPRPRPMGRGLSLTATRADGSEFAVEISLSPVSGPRDALTIASVRDITERLDEAERHRSTREMLALSSERERIARDLHDTVLQRLFGLGLEIQALAMRNVQVSSQLEHAVDEIDLIIKEIRTSVFTLGAARREGSLGQELGDIIAQSARVLGFSPRLSIEGPLEHMVSPRIRPDLTSSLREALANVARHSRATVVSVDLVVHDYELTLRVCDNGIGLTDQALSSVGNGLRNLRTRAEAHGGTCAVRSAQGGGTVLEWTIQLV